MNSKLNFVQLAFSKRRDMGRERKINRLLVFHRCIYHFLKDLQINIIEFIDVEASGAGFMFAEFFKGVGMLFNIYSEV